ncbi:unnamed protein product [Ilex paraguariensis]|uniref:Uncharacterized protein n=1 Tax=Ilex paraguariensis TaxID=185542 RepID=A0ABC8UI18_9AQUA
MNVPQQSLCKNRFKGSMDAMFSNRSRGNQANVANDTNLNYHIPPKCNGSSKQYSFHQARHYSQQKHGSFQASPASLGAFVTVTMLVCIVLYDCAFVKIVRKWTRNPRGITLLQRLGMGLSLHILIMVIASLTERYRLSVAKKHGVVENGGQLPISIFILLPQFVLMGVADACSDVAKIEFFYDQAPETMKSLGTSYAMTSVGIGNFLSSFILTTVSHITKEHGHKGWILNNLNASRLDHYFAFLAILSSLNFIFYLVVTKFYQYKAEVSDSMEVLRGELEVSKNKVTNHVDLQQ